VLRVMIVYECKTRGQFEENSKEKQHGRSVTICVIKKPSQVPTRHVLQNQCHWPRPFCPSKNTHNV